MKIKNMYVQKYKKHKASLLEGVVLKAYGDTYKTGFINESGFDLVDGVEKEYVIVKMYKEQQDVKVRE